MTSDGSTLTGLWFEDRKESGYTETWLSVFDEADRWLDLYFSGRDPGFTPALKTESTDFRKAVWEIMLTIPYGQTMTYGEIAGRIADRQGREHMSAQAVGGAAKHNPILLMIPCHRVVGSAGRLTGYAGGIARKKRLLQLEQAAGGG